MPNNWPFIGRESKWLNDQPLFTRQILQEREEQSSNCLKSNRFNNDGNYLHLPHDMHDRCNMHFKKQKRKKLNCDKKKRCLCLPVSYAPVEFPIIWNELRKNNQLCDGIIRCERDQIFTIHKAILSAVSPYFKALFIHGLHSQNCEEFNLSDVSGEMFSLILDYAYSGKCSINIYNIEKLLPLADRLEVLGLVQLCCQYLLSQLQPHNCLGIYRFAKYYFCDNLEKKCLNYINYNFEEILNESSEFPEINFEDFKTILNDDELNVRNEMLVFKAIKIWVEVCTNERCKYLPQLLNCIRFGLLKSYNIYNYILTWDLIKNQECLQILMPIVLFLSEYSSKKNNCSRNYEKLFIPRIPSHILFAIGGWSLGSPTNLIETYDLRADKWIVLPSVDMAPRAYHGLCTLRNLIYIIGGFDGRKYLNSMCCFNPATKNWEKKSCMHTPRCYVSVCTHGDQIYVLGGNNGWTRLNSCERYDPYTNQWEFIAPMQWKRSDASAVVLDGKIYVAGGFDGRHILDSVEVYEISIGCWSYIAPIGVPRSGVVLVAHKEYLYAIGGFDGRRRLKSIERYNPKEEYSWQKLTPMFDVRSNFAIAVLDNMIYAIGGYNGSRPISSVECYEPKNNKWERISSMNLNRSGLNACVISDLDNVKDYSYHRHYSNKSTKNLSDNRKNNRIPSGPNERAEQFV